MPNNERDQRIAVLSAAGKSNVEIAAAVGCSRNTVTRVLKLPDVQAMIAELTTQVRDEVVKSLAERFDDAATQAFDALLDLMHHAESEAVRFRAIESVLDRSTVSPHKIIHGSLDVRSQSLVAFFTPIEKVREMHALMALLPEEERQRLPEIPEGAVGVRTHRIKETGEVIGERWVMSMGEVKPEEIMP